MNVSLPKKLRQELINYLARRPYHEVFEFIPALESLTPIDGKETTEPALPEA